MNRAERGSVLVPDAAPAPRSKGSDQAATPAVPARAPLGHDADDPHERAREEPPRETRCPIEKLRVEFADRDDDDARAIRRWLRNWDRAIAKGEVIHNCIDAAAARGKRRPNPSRETLSPSASSGAERPRAPASAVSL